MIWSLGFFCVASVHRLNAGRSGMYPEGLCYQPAGTGSQINKKTKNLNGLDLNLSPYTMSNTIDKWV